MIGSRIFRAPLLLQWAILIQILAIVITVQSFLQISPSITTITRNNPRTPSPISSRYDTILSVNPSDDMHHTHPEGNDEHANNREIQNLVVPNRRNFLSGTVASVAATAGMITNPQSIYAATTSTVTSFNIPSSANDLSWPLGKVAFSLIPLAGTSSRRATVEECVVPNTIWTHDQLQVYTLIITFICLVLTFLCFRIKVPSCIWFTFTQGTEKLVFAFKSRGLLPKSNPYIW